jgi:hypothetical protein
MCIAPYKQVITKGLGPPGRSWRDDMGGLRQMSRGLPQHFSQICSSWGLPTPLAQVCLQRPQQPAEALDREMEACSHFQFCHRHGIRLSFHSLEARNPHVRCDEGSNCYGFVLQRKCIYSYIRTVLIAIIYVCVNKHNHSMSSSS